MKSRYFTKFIIIILLVFYSFNLSAQNKNEPKQLEPVVVTATRTPVTQDQLGGSTVKVIGPEEIEASKQTRVADILRQVGGVDITSSGGMGKQTSIFIRGADAKNTLVLIDGIPFNDPSNINRSADIGSLTLDNVERIEVLSGAQSVLYGSNATAGVINIITKKGKDEPEGILGLMGGSYQTYKVHGSATGKTGRFNYSVAASATRMEGFSIANDRNDEIPHEGNTSEKDGYEGATLSANLGYEYLPDQEIAIISRLINSKADLDDWVMAGYAGDRSDGLADGDKEQHNFSSISLNAIKLTNSFDQKLFESKLLASVTNHIRDDYDATGDKLYDFKGRIEQWSWQGTLNFDTNSLSVGVDRSIEFMESKSGNIEPVSATTRSVWVHDQVFLLDEDLVVGIGFRNDTHENFGSAVTHRLAPSLRLGNLKLKASYGTGFLAPSLYQLYSSIGNTDLEPEKSTSRDLGFEYKASSLLIGMSWFDVVFDDRIAYNFSTSKLEQAEGKTFTRGMETFVSVAASPEFSMRVDHTYNETEDPDGEQLAYRPRHKWVVKSTYKPIESLKLSALIRWVGERKAGNSDKTEDGDLVEKMPAYTVVNVAMTHKISKSIEWYFRVDNLNDEFYEEKWSYATPGRSAYAGIKAFF